jgi:uncharacterized protein with NRDE domain
VVVCTLAIYFRHAEALPLLVAANRDEFYARPTAEPQVIAHDPWVVAGQDLSAGGTWLGTNQYGMIVGLLNRRNPNGPDPQRRSRGLLCLEALQSCGPDEVVAQIARKTPAAYNWFNLLVADSQRACVISNAGDRMSVTELPPGVHVLTNLEINDPTCPRIARSHQLFAAVPLCDSADLHPLLARLRAILADHTVPLDPRSDDITNRLCIHSSVYGTRSASVLLQSAPHGGVRYWHAPGPPCRTNFTEVFLPDRASAGHGGPE